SLTSMNSFGFTILCAPRRMLTRSWGAYLPRVRAGGNRACCRKQIPVARGAFRNHLAIRFCSGLLLDNPLPGRFCAKLVFSSRRNPLMPLPLFRHGNRQTRDKKKARNQGPLTGTAGRSRLGRPKIVAQATQESRCGCPGGGDRRRSARV